MNYPRSSITDVETELINALDRVLPGSSISTGDRVAVGVGSRGITHLPQMVRTLCRRLTEVGAKPFIIPAMGSHGNATAHGQEKVLESLGITEATCKVPIRSSMHVRQIGTALGDVPVYYATDALAADHSICINRIKPHTKFKAPVASGLHKMLCIGMGKHQGAMAFHQWVLKYGFYPLVTAITDVIRQQSNLRFAVGIVEDAYDQPLAIEALVPDQLLEREKQLCQLAEEHFPRLPVRNADVLVIGQIGKEISGAGMDPNVTGRAFDLKEDDFSQMFHATRIAILNLSEKTAGNGVGLGNADIITEKVFQNLDYEKTLMNALTGISLRKAFIPVRMPNDRKAIQACFTTVGPMAPEDVRAIFIRDTRHVTEFWTTRPVVNDLKSNVHAQIMKPTALRFNENGDLISPDLGPFAQVI